MVKKFNILVVEDNEYYNGLITNALHQSASFMRQKVRGQLTLHSFIDSDECIQKIESHEFMDSNTIAFVDQNIGMGISGSQIISLLKKENVNTMAILLSQSKNTEDIYSLNNHDHFVVKDIFAPELCSIHLDRYIEDKFL